MDSTAVLKLHTIKDIEDIAAGAGVGNTEEKKEAKSDVTILKTGCPFFYGYKKTDS